MKTREFIVLAFGCAVVVLACDECGEECRKMCGTKQFKTCCFNYLRKRSMPHETGPDLRLEVSLAKNQQRGIIPPYLAYLSPLAQYSPFLYQNQRAAAAVANRQSDPPDQGTLQLLYDA